MAYLNKLPVKATFIKQYVVIKNQEAMYSVDDNLMTVFAFESGSATIYSFTKEPKVINL